MTCEIVQVFALVLITYLTVLFLQLSIENRPDVLRRVLFTANGGREVPQPSITFVWEALEIWMTSNDPEITEAHLNLVENPPQYLKGPLGFYVMLAKALWSAMSDPFKSDVSITHNGYLKLFAMSGGQMLNPMTGNPFDLIMVDEAQDLNKVTLQKIRNQRTGAKILVGDPHQVCKKCVIDYHAALMSSAFDLTSIHLIL